MDNTGWKPLHYAAACEYPHAVKLLLEMGASSDAGNWEGTTTLHVAAMQGRVENIKLLLKHRP